MKKLLIAAAVSILATSAYAQVIKGTGGQATGNPVTLDSTTTGGQGTGTGQNSDAVEGGLRNEDSMSAKPILPQDAAKAAGQAEDNTTTGAIGSSNTGEPVTEDSTTTGGQGTGSGQNSNLIEGNSLGEKSGSAVPAN